MQGTLATKDTYIDGHNVNGNNGEEGVIYIGRSTSIGAPLVGLIRFDVPQTSEQFTASLCMVPQYCAVQNGPQSINLALAVYPLDWDEFAVSWQSSGGLNDLIDPSSPQIGTIELVPNLDVTQVFDVTTLIQAAVQESRQYIDILAFPATEVRSSCTYYSKDSGTHPERGPRLAVLNG